MIIWREALSVGVDLIDTEHQELIRKLNDFMEACTKQSGKDKILETLSFLKNYTVEHFSDEERLMQEVEYPDYPVHKQIHDGFVNKVEELEHSVLEKGPSVLSTIKLNRLLVDWLINHITKTDVHIGEYIKNREAAS